jgi:hypothetical protein
VSEECHHDFNVNYLKQLVIYNRLASATFTQMGVYLLASAERDDSLSAAFRLNQEQ